MKGKVSIGLLLYNDEKHLTQTLESLLSQSYKEFQIIVSNDCSPDDVENIVLKYASKDKRIKYYRNDKRLGMIGNYRVCFERAGNDVKYFAWASGHDVYHPRWLETLVKALDDNPAAVMAYLWNDRISDAGDHLRDEKREFNTCGLSVKERIRKTCLEAKGSGNMIYGLFRKEALPRAGVFRKYIYPDLLLLSEMSLFGEIVQIPEILWSRRHVDLFSLDRQKRTLFARRPWYIYFPWIVTHLSSVAWNHVIHPNAGSLHDRSRALYLMLMMVRRMIGRGFTNVYRAWVGFKEKVVAARSR